MVGKCERLKENLIIEYKFFLIGLVYVVYVSGENLFIYILIILFN